MSAWIHHIETITPEHAYMQDYAATKMQEWIADEKQSRIIRVLYKKSGIDQRHSVIGNFDDEQRPEAFFRRDGRDRLQEPSTAARNAIYAREAQRLSVELAGRTISACPGIEAGDISHVITASCTGFSNPGSDYHIVNNLGLSATTQRYNLGFMGCYAAFPALNMARQFCVANPDAVVLVLCLELCTLHLQLNHREDSMLANSLFSDGAAAVIVSARQPQADRSAFRLGDFRSGLVPDGEADMAWTVGDLGFDIALSSYVPRIIGANIRQAIEPLLETGELPLDQVRSWAVHPGGKAILDKVAGSLGLNENQIAASRKVLRDYGNMSSATVLFVLREILNDCQAPERENICAMAFGPGLTVEMGLLEARRCCLSQRTGAVPETLSAVA
jgi:predicted naringenin-chalcone synthase